MPGNRVPKLDLETFVMTATTGKLLAEAESVFGRTLTLSIAMGKWPSDERMASDDEPVGDPAAEDRLREALSIARMLLEVEALDTVQAWFCGRNPILHDRAPALVLAEDPAAVRFAARDLVAYG